MAFFYTICFLAYAMLQVLMSRDKAVPMGHEIGRVLLLVFVPGVLFVLGRLAGELMKEKDQESLRAWLGKAMLLSYGCWMVAAAAQEIFLNGRGKKASLSDVLSIMTIPSISAIFFAVALTLLLIKAFLPEIRKLAASEKAMQTAAVLCLPCALLQIRGEGYVLLAAFIGSRSEYAIPVIPYFAYVWAGMWTVRKEEGFAGKTAIKAAVITLASVILYRTGLKPLCFVTMSALPVYLVYAFSGWIAGKLSTSKKKEQTVKEKAPFRGLLEYWDKRVRHKTAAYFVIFTIVFSGFLFLTFFEFYRTGTTFIIKGDGISQYYPRIIYFSRYIRELFSNLLSGNLELPMYDFRFGLGSEVTYSLEPLYFLYALFDEEHLEFAYNLVTMLRFYLSGVTMSILCLYFKKGYFATFLGSVVYVISGFALYGGSMHTMFMIPMIMLPLLILAIEEILRRKKWYLVTIFVAISLFSNYYYLYMNTIAMGVYFLVRFFSSRNKEERTFKKFMGRALTICWTYLLGVAMSCIVLVTTFGMYLGSGRGTGIQIKTPSFFYYSKEWLLSCFMTFLTTANSAGEWMKLGFLPIAMLAVIILFMRKGRRELKILSVITVIFMAFPLFGFVFSGFSAVINRWCYMIALLVGFIVAECFEDLREMTKKEVLTCAAVTAAYGFLAFYGTYKSTKYTQAAFVLLIITLAVQLLCQTKCKWLSEVAKRGLMFVLTAVLVFWQGYSLFHMDERIDGYADPGQSLRKVTDNPLQALEEIEDDSFYRAAVPTLAYYNGNSPFILDYNGTTIICSTFNGSIMEYLDQMGGIGYTMTQMLGMSNRTMMNNLASVKYYGYYEGETRPLAYGSEVVLETEVNGQKAYICENQYALPLAYTYSDSITEEELERYPVLERQEVLMQKVLLNDAEESTGEAAEVTATELEITKIEEMGLVLTEHALTREEDSDGKKLKLHFESLPNSELYLVLEGASLEGDMSEKSLNIKVKAGSNTVSYSFKPDDFRYHTGQEDYVFNLGYYEEPVTSCTVSLGRAGRIDLESLKVYSQPMDQVPQYTETLTEDVMEHIKVETNQVSGSISLEEDKILVLSIPYQKGWTAYVDGEEVKLQRANYAYMALPLEAGEHEIELEFAIPGIRTALTLMGGSSAFFVLLLVLDFVRKRKGKHGEKENR